MSSDKGWNDPPVQNYSPQNETNQQKRSQLTKRVPFPAGTLLNTDVSTESPGLQLVPPAVNAQTAVSKPPTAVQLISQDTTVIQKHLEESLDSGTTISDEDRHTETVNALKECLTVCSKTLQKRTVDDIERRIRVLSTMWTDGKLKNDVKIKMLQLCKDLHNGDYDKANNTHLALIVDHCNQVTPWMVGVKHLIHESRNVRLHLEREQSECNYDLSKSSLDTMM